MDATHTPKASPRNNRGARQGRAALPCLSRSDAGIHASSLLEFNSKLSWRFIMLKSDTRIAPAARAAVAMGVA